MVSMLDERDKLMDSLREAQERLNEMEGKLGDCEKERDSLHRQINANLPQVSVEPFFSSCSISILIPIDLVSWELSRLVNARCKTRKKKQRQFPAD